MNRTKEIYSKCRIHEIAFIGRQCPACALQAERSTKIRTLNELTEHKLSQGLDSEKRGIKTRRQVPLTDLIHREAMMLTIDDVDSFGEVRRIRSLSNGYVPIDEKWFKEGLKRIIGEFGVFRDWGGESNDLFTTRIVLNGKRVRAAFALKGKGTKGKLVPKKMGAQGDQLQRLLDSEADVFFVQYWGQVSESIVDLLSKLANAKASSQDSVIYFGIIDGKDTQRIVAAYREYFPSIE